MGKLKINKKNNMYVISNKLTENEDLNEQQSDRINRNEIENLIPLQIIKGKKKLVNCYITGVVPLEMYIKGEINRSSFFQIVIQTIQVIKNIDKMSFHGKNLYLDNKYIFLELNSYRLKFIYWPIVNNNNFTSPYNYFKELPYSIIFNKFEDTNYVTKYIQYFNTTKTFSIGQFERFIQNLQNESSTDILNVNLQRQSSTLENIEVIGSVKKLENSNQVVSTKVEINPPYITITNDVQFMREMDDYDTSKTTIIGHVNENSGTTVLGEEVKVIKYPYLIREKGKIKIEIIKPIFSIGKLFNACDYVVEDNNAVSRKHITIQTVNCKYFVVDNQSTNKTYVNGKPIPTQTEVEIRNEDVLVLGNEMFTFYEEAGGI